MPKNNQGHLTLKVVRALDLQETGILKYQDPFVVIETPKQRLETAVAKGAGSDPEWKEAFELEVTPGEQAGLTLRLGYTWLCWLLTHLQRQPSTVHKQHWQHLFTTELRTRTHHRTRQCQ